MSEWTAVRGQVLIGRFSQIDGLLSSVINFWFCFYRLLVSVYPLSNLQSSAVESLSSVLQREISGELAYGVLLHFPRRLEGELHQFPKFLRN